jgi:Yip1 domain
MSIIDRARNILTKPVEEWPVIAKESGDIIGLYKNYACILALIPLIMGLLVTLVLGALLASMLGGVAGSVGFGVLLVSQIVSYVMGLAALFAIAFVVSAVSPSFNGKQDLFQSAKLIIYSTTPVWLSTIFLIIPLLGVLIILAAIAYAVYLVYLGSNPVLGIPQEKVAGFTVVIVLIYLVVGFVMYVVQNLLSFASPAVM